MNKPNIPTIACELYDHLELACLHQYELTVVLHNRQCITGRAVDVKIMEHEEGKYQGLLLKTVTGEILNIACDQLKSIQALTPGARFNLINF
jgi:Rho-binding antiterminator